jgi:hypothetical protein
MPNFTVYGRQRAGSRVRRGLGVTVTARGCIAFTEDAWAALGSPEAVRFLIGTGGGRLVGFQGCRPGDPDARSARPGCHIITAVALLRDLGHDLGTARRYTLRVEAGMPPYIDLDEDAPAARG